MNKEKAEIIGFLCAEGNYYDKRISYWEYSKERGKYYYKNNKRNVYLQFGNFSRNILQRFQSLINHEYEYRPNIYPDRIRLCRRAVIKDLLYYTDYGCLNWDVPKQIVGNKKLAAAFLRGYFEGDGCLRDMVFSSSNFRGLQKVRNLLDLFGIKSSLRGPYIRENREPAYELYILKNTQNLFFQKIKPPFKSKPL